ncbi:MAG: competence/damage-inducible protein A [Gemmatimonadota bacterium]|nr:competence/damage-inducible protein A [Gemmatimonadota bacterium]
MDVIILSIGAEILKGRTLNTNAHYMSGRLYAAGFNVIETRCVDDNEERIMETLESCFKVAGIVIATGGLGPTRDDVTLKAAARFFNRPLLVNRNLAARLEKLFKSMGYPSTPEKSRNQALAPEGAVTLPNKRGTAGGVLLEEEGKMLFLLPGVPVEMKGLLDEEVLPLLLKRFAPGEPVTRTVRTIGIGESTLAQMIEEGLIEQERSLVSYYPHGGMVDLVIAGSASGKQPVDPAVIRRVAGHLAACAGNYVYTTDEKSIFQVIAGLLKSRGLKLAVAESCTGGLVAKTITDQPGSSEYFQAGVVSYSNEAKSTFLGVEDNLIAEHGAVSEPVAGAMALGLKEKTGADYTLAITGIAGPGGGSSEKPVGTLFIALSGPGHAAEVQRFSFRGDREQIRHSSMVKAAEILWRKLILQKQE